MIGDTSSRQVQSIHTGFQIVQHLQNRDGATMNELAEELDIAKSTVHNYLQTLKSLGYIVEREGRYRLGLRFLTHGMAAKNSLTIKEFVTDVLSQTATQLSLPTWWIIEEFGRGIFVDRQTPNGQNVVYGRIGKRSFLHTHALGKAILAQLSEDYVSQIIDYHGLPTYTRETTTDADKLRKELARIRDAGYAVSEGEAALGVRSVGVGFEGAYGYTHAIGVFGYSHNFTGATHDRDIHTILQETARTIKQSAEQAGEQA